MKPLTAEEVDRLFAEQGWAELATRIHEHLRVCEPLLPEMLAALDPVERELFKEIIVRLGPRSDAPRH